jgi:hypothetical protein
MGGACSTYEDWRDALRVLVERPAVKRLLLIPRRRGRIIFKRIFSIGMRRLGIGAGGGLL